MPDESCSHASIESSESSRIVPFPLGGRTNTAPKVGEFVSALFHRLNRLLPEDQKVVTIPPNQEIIAANQARLRARPGILAQRHALAEHPFGTLKFWLGYRAFLCRGLEMVRAEFSLSCLAYNLRRALNVLGIGRLLQALRPAPSTA